MSTSYLLCLCRVQMKSLLLYCLGPVTWEELDITCHNINTIFIIFSSDNDLDYRHTWDGEFVPFYFLLVSKNLKIGIVHLVYSSKRPNSQFPHAAPPQPSPCIRCCRERWARPWRRWRTPRGGSSRPWARPWWRTCPLPAWWGNFVVKHWPTNGPKLSKMLTLT